MALWSSRFEEAPVDAVREFTESISFDKRLYKHDVAGSIAHSAMLAEVGIITRDDAAEIAVALREIEKEIESGEFPFSAELEDIHMHIENALIAKIGDTGARLHTGRSRNDQVALDIRLYMKSAAAEITGSLRALQASLIDLADRNSDVLMPGFTHLQHAQPVLFAHHILAYVEMFDRDASRLADCVSRFNASPLGSGALAGSTLPLDRAKTAELLGFDGTTSNSMDAVADRDFICEFISDIAIFAMHVSRLSEDVILWVSSEFGFAELSDAYCTGSSLMPQKKNPDVAELARGKSARIYGDLTAILTLCKGLPMTYNRDLQEDKVPLFDAIDTALDVLSVFPGMMATMTIHRERMREAVSDPALMATDVAEALVKDGMPFRNAHHRVGALVKWCAENAKKLNELTLEEMRETIPEARYEYMKLFSPDKSVAAREIRGATGPGEVRARLDEWKRKLS
ncbi:MAG: argininosuccinate lyase [Kiritimatiellaeota bacterium]|nr:argininosuccinate lyase [Kiritimatiellota bacterium]